MTPYEYPLNEHVRTLLRLEEVFAQALHCLGASSALDHHCALLWIFQILDIAERMELKGDLLLDLNRQQQVMAGLRGNPAISDTVLNEVSEEINHAMDVLRSISKPGQTVRDNEWLSGIRQRSGVSGTAFKFDTPSYQHWLAQPADQRKRDIEAWLADVLPLYTGTCVILKILRGSGTPVRLLAERGSYQQMLGGNRPVQMLRVTPTGEQPCFPEISANKYAINIRFNQTQQGHKPASCDVDVPFELALCSL